LLRHIYSCLDVKSAVHDCFQCVDMLSHDNEMREVIDGFSIYL